MEMTNRLFKGVVLALMMLAVPVYAQDVVKIRFGQDGLDKDKKYHRIAVNFNYKSDCAELEKACAKFFFNDSVSTSLEAAVKNYQAQFTTSKKYASQPDAEHNFMLSIADNSSSKYTSYLLGKADMTYDGNTQKKKKLTWNVVYDNMNDRMLTVDDIFVPNEAAKIKETIGKRRPQLFVTNSGVVWGYMVKGSLVQNKCLYKEKPEIYTEQFRQLIGDDAFVPAIAKDNEVPVGGGNNEAAGEVLKAKEVIARQDPKTGAVKVFDVVEQMPAFPGGPSALFEYLSKSIKYPRKAEENGVQGRVIVSFVVERDGSITNVGVVKSVEPSLDKEAVRVIKSMPKWIPGKQKGNAVRVKYTTPVTFRLQ